jgi:hypothetical protein
MLHRSSSTTSVGSDIPAFRLTLEPPFLIEGLAAGIAIGIFRKIPKGKRDHSFVKIILLWITAVNRGPFRRRLQLHPVPMILPPTMVRSALVLRIALAGTARMSCGAGVARAKASGTKTGYPYCTKAPSPLPPRRASADG